MPRPLRIQDAGIRHVTCRGNRGQPIFLDPVDREWYLRELAAVCRELEWRVLAWCLMTNHVHLVLDVPAGTISDGMQLLSGNYAGAFNGKHGYSGHLFQGRFRAELVVDERHALEVVRYVDLNPVRAGIVRHPEEWPWSSYRAFTGIERPRPFHDAEWTLRRFDSDVRLGRIGYEDYLAQGAAESRRRAVPGPVRGLTPGMARRDGGALTWVR